MKAPSYSIGSRTGTTAPTASVRTLISSVTRWTCPNCPAEDTTTNPGPHTRFHTCPGLRGLTAPMVKAGTKAKVEAREREDYLGTDVPQRDEDGRVVMSIVTTRSDGQDVVVLAPTATKGRANGRNQR